MIGVSVMHRTAKHASPLAHTLMSSIYLFVPPMLNPIIYSVKTKPIQQGIVTLFSCKRELLWVIPRAGRDFESVHKLWWCFFCGQNATPGFLGKNRSEKFKTLPWAWIWITGVTLTPCHLICYQHRCVCMCPCICHLWQLWSTWDLECPLPVFLKAHTKQSDK